MSPSRTAHSAPRTRARPTRRTRSGLRQLDGQTPVMTFHKLKPYVEFFLAAVGSEVQLDPQKLGGREMSVLVDARSRFAVNVCHAYIAVWCRGLAVKAGYDGIRGGHQHESDGLGRTYALSRLMSYTARPESRPQPFPLPLVRRRHSSAYPIHEVLLASETPRWHRPHSLTRLLRVPENRLNSNVLDARMSKYRDDASRVKQIDWIVSLWCVRRCVVSQDVSCSSDIHLPQ
ncbi:hypothetical protein C8Q76DRAFT_248092 [Earliella scabrosa]|nr:hypothetical protein C8Q76DRAFT_248092 [Earliella scabrosa]